MDNRVVITGLGVVSAIGTDIPSFTSGLRDGSSGIKQVVQFDTSEMRNPLAGEVGNYTITDTTIRNNDRCLAFILDAVTQAIEDSGINLSNLVHNRCGVAIATSLGCVENLERYIKAGLKNNDRTIEQMNDVPHGIPAAFIARRYGFTGPVICIDTACASGSSTLGYAFDLIKNGICDLVIAGGVDVLNLLSYSGFSGMMNLSKTVCRPFNNNPPGLILGEGSGIAILENLDGALKRECTIYGEVKGYGLSNDAFHETKPDPEGGGAILSMKMALEQAGMSPVDIDYINAHGTGTKFNDLMELAAIKKVFGSHAVKTKISSIKAAIGHTLGAAGAVEFVATVCNIHNDFVSPTINFECPIEGNEEFDFVPNKAQELPVRAAISNSFGFAGNCCSIVAVKYLDG